MSLTRRTALTLLAALPAARVWAQPLEYGLAPRPVADGIWLVEGTRDYFSRANGGNIVNTVLVGTDAGTLVIDTGSTRRYGEELRAAAEAATGRPVIEVWNTHHHPDHVLGNQAFADLPIRALPATADLAAEHGEGYADSLYRLLGDWMRGTSVVPPSGTLAGGEVELGGRRLRLMPFSGHSEADLAILDTRSGVLVPGDLVFRDRAPATASADLAAWRESLGALRRIGGSAILPGHGPLHRDASGIEQTLNYLDWLETTLRSAARDGLDMMEAMAADLPARHALLGAQPGEFHRSVVHLFPGLEKEVLPIAN